MYLMPKSQACFFLSVVTTSSKIYLFQQKSHKEVTKIKNSCQLTCFAFRFYNNNDKPTMRESKVTTKINFECCFLFFLAVDLMTYKCCKGGTEVDIGGSDTSPPDTLVSSLTVTQE